MLVMPAGFLRPPALPAGSGPGLLAAPANNIRPLELATAGLGLGEALTVAPLLPLGPALGALGLGLGIGLVAGLLLLGSTQGWGQQNQRQKLPTTKLDPLSSYPIGSKSVNGLTWYRITGGSITFTAVNGSTANPVVQLRSKNLTYNGNSYLPAGYSVRVGLRPDGTPAYFVSGTPSGEAWDFINDAYVGSPQVQFPVIAVSAVVEAVPISTGPTQALSGDPLTGGGPDPLALVPAVPSFAPLPAYLPGTTPGSMPGTVPQRSPEPQPATAPDVADPNPPAIPAVPAVEIGEQTRQDIIRRALPLITAAPQITGAVPLDNTGSTVTRQPAPAQPTPQDVRVYGSRVITSGNPRTDPQAVAEELGRIEKKLGSLLEVRDPVPDWLDSLAGNLIPRIVGAIVDALTVDVPAQTWTLTAPCNTDSNDQPETFSQEIAGADFPEATIARLEAIMAALQVLKGWRQPVCRGGPKSNVTVTAFEIEPEG